MLGQELKHLSHAELFFKNDTTILLNQFVRVSEICYLYNDTALELQLN